MDTVKEDLCQFNELLFALNGFFSHDYQLDSSFKLSSFESRFSTLHCLPQVAELLNLSWLYSQLNEYLVDYSTQTDQFKFLIFNLINKAIDKTYISELISFDTYHKLNNDAVIKLNNLLKHKYFFIDILGTLNDLNEHNKSFALLKLSNLFKIKYEIALDSGENDPFFQGMWTWLISGTLPYDLRNSFFISSQSYDNYCLDYTKFPDSIEPRNAMQIHNVGNLIRYIHSYGVQTNLSHSQLFWKYFQQRHSLYNSSVLFKYFLGDIKSFVFENILHVTKAKESYLKYLQHLKIFFLYGNECFWTNFACICRASTSCDGRTLFRRAIYTTFDDSTADYYISCISVKMEKQKNAFCIKLGFKHSPMVKIMFAENSINKYQVIFAHLYKLHSTRCELIANWKGRSSSSGYFTKQNYLHYCLLHTFSIFYTYSKFCVEYKMATYLESIENTIEIDQIQKLHDTCLLDIIKRLFIKNSFIANMQNGLVELSQEMHQLGSDIDSLLAKYNQILEAYRSCFQLNRKHVNIFSEILDMI